MKRLLSIVLVFCMVVGTNALAAESTENTAPTTQEMPAGGRGGMQPPQGGGMPEGEVPAMPEGEVPAMPEGEVPAMPEGEAPAADGSTTREADAAAIDASAERHQESEGIAQAMENAGQDGAQPAGVLGFLKTYSTSVVAVLLLMVAFIFVKFYKRKQY